MSAIIDEHTQWMDSDGKPLNAGKLYIGTAGGDPVQTAGVTTIYSDRDLSVSIDNPQNLDANGRATNKIWFDGKYSIQVNNSAAVQKYQELDAGEASSGVSVVQLSSVAGTNTITATGTPTITAYTDGQMFIFKAASANTGSVTLNVDGVGAKSLKMFRSLVVLNGMLKINQTIVVVYNSTEDSFEWLNVTMQTIPFFEGTSVASATTPDIWAVNGNTLHITGTTGITGFAAAPNVGARRTIIMDGIVTFTNSANLALPGGANFTTIAGDVFEVYADTLTQFDVSFKGNIPASTAEGTTGTATRRFPPVAVVKSMINTHKKTIGTPIATTSGTTQSFTGLPNTVTEITLMFSGISTDGVEELLVLLGDSGGYESSGYLSNVSAAASTDASTVGFILTVGQTASELFSGEVTFSKFSGNKWVQKGSLINGQSSAAVRVSAGEKTLSGVLTQIRLTTTGTPDTFDAGELNIRYS